MPLPLLLCCTSGLGPEGLLHNCTIPVWSPGNLLRVTLASRENSASENLQQETKQPKCCLYKTPYVAAPVRETGDVITRTPLYAWLPTDAPIRTRFFLVHKKRVSQETRLIKLKALTSLFYQDATCKSSTLAGLLYAPDPKKCKKGTLSDQPWLSRVTFTAPLCHWGQQLLKDMMSLGTDFETHAIWQGYVEDPAAKDFVVRKAHTFALSEARGTQQSTLFTSLEIPWGFRTWAVLRSLAGLMSRKKVSVWGFLWGRKVWFPFAQRTFAWETFGKRRKGERSPVVKLLPGSYEHNAFRNPHILCQKYWGCMYNVPPWSVKGTRNRTRNQIPMQPRKVQWN